MDNIANFVTPQFIHLYNRGDKTDGDDNYDGNGDDDDGAYEYDNRLSFRIVEKFWLINLTAFNSVITY